MVHGQAFRIITLYPPLRGPYAPPREHTEQLCGREPWEPSPAPNPQVESISRVSLFSLQLIIA